MSAANYRIVVIAGDISPIDVISHLPVLCEEASVKYIYTPSRTELGTASATKRPTSCVMVCPNDEFKENYDECLQELKAH